MKEQSILIISPFYNAEKYLPMCIESVASQNYKNYLHILIDDCSTDNSLEVARNCIEKLPEYIRHNFELIHRTQNIGAVGNQILSIKDYVGKSEKIIMLLDGDDALVNNPNIFNFYNNLYDGTTEFTYGSCWSLADNIPLISQPYPPEIKKNKKYREYKFNWNMPYTHLRTFSSSLFSRVKEENFKDENGNWYRAGGDNSTFYNILEQADPNKVKVVSEIMYLYNDINPLNDYKINSEEQTKNSNLILNNGNKMKKKILIAIPTAKYIESETFKSIYDLIIPDGYEVEFQYFYGYQIDQIRNLISSWVVNRFDYLFSVDSDIILPKDSLMKLLNHNKDVVSGMYIQRIPNTYNLELYNFNGTRITKDKIIENCLMEIGGCGFGCVLVKKEVFVSIGYPQFVYKDAIDHKDTVSEDTYFCAKAREKGYKVWVDTSIKCNHIGNAHYMV